MATFSGTVAEIVSDPLRSTPAPHDLVATVGVPVESIVALKSVDCRFTPFVGATLVVVTL